MNQRDKEGIIPASLIQAEDESIAQFDPRSTEGFHLIISGIVFGELDLESPTSSDVIVQMIKGSSLRTLVSNPAIENIMEDWPQANDLFIRFFVEQVRLIAPEGSNINGKQLFRAYSLAVKAVREITVRQFSHIMFYVESVFEVADYFAIPIDKEIVVEVKTTNQPLYQKYIEYARKWEESVG
ncbi:hypothetical protein KKA15_01825 [Patescibacteria group bacterium]|nr:hypothetical protein [Patescibacteria group bacterium]